MPSWVLFLYQLYMLLSQDIVDWAVSLCALYPRITGAHGVAARSTAIHVLDTWMDMHMDEVNKWGNVGCCEGAWWQWNSLSWQQAGCSHLSSTVVNWQGPAHSFQKQGWKKRQGQCRFRASGRPKQEPSLQLSICSAAWNYWNKTFMSAHHPSPSSKPYLIMVWQDKRTQARPVKWMGCVSTRGRPLCSWKTVLLKMRVIADSTLVHARWTAKERAKGEKGQRHWEWAVAQVTVRSLSYKPCAPSYCTVVRTEISLSCSHMQNFVQAGSH